MKGKLSARELQVAELLAWGAERKEVPSLLQQQYGGKEISLNTVNNIVTNIYSKLYLQNEKELSAWYFCEIQGVDRDKSPLKQLCRSIYAILMLVILLPQITNLDQMLRPSNARTTSTLMARGARNARSSGRTAKINGRKEL